MGIARISVVSLALVGVMMAGASAQDRGGDGGGNRPVRAAPGIHQPAIPPVPAGTNPAVSNGAKGGVSTGASPAASGGAPAGVRTGASEGRGFGADSQWRYHQSGGRWWYWAPENRWMWWDDQQQHWTYGDPKTAGGSGESPAYDENSGCQPVYSSATVYRRAYEAYPRYASACCRPGVVVKTPGVSVAVGGGHVTVDVGRLHLGF
jgi:hypothetical protein